MAERVVPESRPAYRFGDEPVPPSAEWNADIERVVVKLGRDWSLHIDPMPVRELAYSILEAVLASRRGHEDGYEYEWHPRKVTLAELTDKIKAEQS